MAHNPLKINRDYEKGVAFATLCYVMWGILPVYWKALDPINPVLIMFYRLIMAFLFVVVMALIIYKPKEILAPIKEKGGDNKLSQQRHAHILQLGYLYLGSQ
jgi:EamA domain-containing membrane protein RarD